MADAITVDELYAGIEQAETGHLNPGMARYVRTSASTEGSSAFGPVQMTKKILSGVGYSDIKFTDEEDAFVQNVLIPQANKFLKYGNEPKLEGYDIKYDYSDNDIPGSGVGDFTPADTTMYKQVAKKVMAYEFGPMRAKGNVDTFIRNWRGAPEFDENGKDGNIIKGDDRYYKEVRSKLGINNKAFDAMLDSTSSTPALDIIKLELTK